MLNFEIIETERLILKGLTPQSMTLIFENYSKNEIKRILGHQTEASYKKDEYKQKNGYSCYNRSFLLFLLTEKISGHVIGRCGIHNWNAEHNRGEIGYEITHENYKRRGFMTEAVHGVIEYGFTNMQLNRIEAMVGTDNYPSLKIIEKFNFKKEGVLSQHYHDSGKYEDSFLFSKLYSEYHNELKNLPQGNKQP